MYLLPCILGSKYPKIVTTWVNKPNTFSQIAFVLELVSVYLLDKSQRVPFSACQTQSKQKKWEPFFGNRKGQKPKKQKVRESDNHDHGNKQNAASKTCFGEITNSKNTDCRLETSEPLKRTSNRFEVAPSRAFVAFQISENL